MIFSDFHTRTKDREQTSMGGISQVSLALRGLKHGDPGLMASLSYGKTLSQKPGRQIINVRALT